MALSGRRVRVRLHHLFTALVTGIAIALSLATALALAETARADAPVIAAAGDIACDPANSSFNNSSSSCREMYTSNLLVNAGLAAVLPLGDNQYYCGGYDAFTGSYDRSWGRVKSITHPAVGNHEYLTHGGTSGATGCDTSNTGAAGYFRYFGAAAGAPNQGYYSYDVGTWHLIALNTNCSSAGGCSASSAQGKWLTADLAAHPNQCTLAYWHIPLFSSGGRANSNSRSFWDALYAAKADVILSAHDHTYERFAPQSPAGALDPTNGIREFIVGTGGANHTSLAARAANSELFDEKTFGVLKMTLYPDHYTWQFVPEAGKTFTDAGTQNCHAGAPTTPDTTKPSAPANLGANAISGNQVDLSWSASSDDVGVAGYRVYRGTTQIATTTNTNYSDTGVAPNTSYDYHVTAYDFAGNESDPSSTVTATTPAPNSVLTFTATADTYAAADTPATVLGSSSQFITDNSPVKHLFVRFSVAGVNGRGVLSAKLRLYCVNSSNMGGSFHGSDPVWSESSLNWNLQPTIQSAVVSSIGSVTSGRWYETDVTPLVLGDGTVSIAATSTSTDGAYYATKEGAAGFAPQLVVTTAG
jgi:acid phosphatase type 7